MGLTVANIVERSYEEILEAGGTSRPAFDVQEGTITDTDVDLTVEGRQDFIPPDGLVEWWDDSMEVAEVKTAENTDITLQTRGYLGTTAAAHTDGTKVVLDNPYPRYILLNGLKAVIGQLYGFGIYVKTNSAGVLTISSTPTTLPTGSRGIVGNVIYEFDGIEYHPLVKGKHWNLIHAFDPPKIQFNTWHAGRTIYFDYKKDFDTSTFALSTDLDDVGIPSTLQQHLALGLAGHILMGRDVPALENEHIRPDPQAPQQPGTKASIGELLWRRFIQGPVMAERTRVLEQHPTVTTTGGV